MDKASCPWEEAGVLVEVGIQEVGASALLAVAAFPFAAVVLFQPHSCGGSSWLAAPALHAFPAALFASALPVPRSSAPCHRPSACILCPHHIPPWSGCG